MGFDLREALVGPDKWQLYNTSPSFKHAIDTLVLMLPAWVDGLAERSEETDRNVAKAIEAASWGYGPVKRME